MRIRGAAAAATAAADRAQLLLHSAQRADVLHGAPSRFAAARLRSHLVEMVTLPRAHGAAPQPTRLTRFTNCCESRFTTASLKRRGALDRRRRGRRAAADRAQLLLHAAQGADVLHGAASRHPLDGKTVGQSAKLPWHFLLDLFFY